MCFDSFQRQAHLHIIFHINIVESEVEVSEHWTIPTLTATDDVVIDLFYFLWGKPSRNRFSDELVVMFTVESHIFMGFDLAMALPA